MPITEIFHVDDMIDLNNKNPEKALLQKEHVKERIGGIEDVEASIDKINTFCTNNNMAMDMFFNSEKGILPLCEKYKIV